MKQALQSLSLKISRINPRHLQIVMTILTITGGVIIMGSPVGGGGGTPGGI
jgi:hypothetical protein